jgi:hypothetical protein
LTGTDKKKSREIRTTAIAAKEPDRATGKKSRPHGRKKGPGEEGVSLGFEQKTTTDNNPLRSPTSPTMQSFGQNQPLTSASDLRSPTAIMNQTPSALRDPSTSTMRDFQVKVDVGLNKILDFLPSPLTLKGVRMPLKLDVKAVRRESLDPESSMKDRITKRALNQ